MNGLACQGELLVLLVHCDVTATGNATSTHTACNDCCVGGHTATNGQDTLSGFHTGNVFRRGFQTNEDNLLAGCFPSHSVFCGEDNLSASGSGGCTQASAERFCGFESLCIELRVKQSVKVAGIDHQNGFFLGSLAFVYEVAGDAESCLSGTLAVTCLEHIKFAVLNGEFHILHISVMVFENLADVLELCECFGEFLCHLSDRHRRTDTCNDVLALCVGQELAHEFLFAGSGITGKCNTGSAIVTHVTECHHLHVDCSSPAVRNVVVTTVDVCTGVVPRTEHGFDSTDELFLRIGREIDTDLGLVLCFELVSQFFEVVGIEFDVISNAFLCLHLVDELLEILLADFHNDVGVHLNKSAVAVPSPSRVVGFLSDDIDDFFIQTEVQNGVHHTRHGCTGTGTDGNEQRVLVVTEFLTGDFLHFGDILHNLCHNAVIDLSAVLIVLGAGFGRNGEALRNGKSDVGHFGKVRTFTAEQFTHVCVALGKEVAILLCHKC